MTILTDDELQGLLEVHALVSADQATDLAKSILIARGTIAKLNERIERLNKRLGVEAIANDQLAHSYGVTSRLVGELRALLNEASVCVEECGFHKVGWHEDLEKRIRMSGAFERRCDD